MIKTVLILSGLISLLIITLIVISFMPRTPFKPDSWLESLTPHTSPTPLPSARNNTIPIPATSRDKQLPTQKSYIGSKEFNEKDPNISVIKKETLLDGEIKYFIKSENVGIPGEILTRQGEVIYERILTAAEKQNPNHTTTNELLQKYGQPTIMYNGHKIYGHPALTYLYPDKGIAFTANKFTSEVYEIQIFSPTTADQYLKLYGQDITFEGPAKEDFGY